MIPAHDCHIELFADILTFNPFAITTADGAAPISTTPLEARAETPLASLTESEREAVLRVPAAKDPDKLRLFARWVAAAEGLPFCWHL